MVECLSRARRLLGSALQKNKMGGGSPPCVQDSHEPSVAGEVPAQLQV